MVEKPFLERIIPDLVLGFNKSVTARTIFTASQFGLPILGESSRSAEWCHRMSLQTAATRSGHGFDRAALARSAAVWAAIIVAVVFLRHMYANGPDVFASAGGPDDATRLLQVRDLFAGGVWFDRSIASIGAPEALVSHWSRFIDLAIGSLVSLAQVFTTGHGAELVARIMWPAVLLFALCLVVLRDAQRQAGGFAVAAAVILILNGYSALVQFYPGRIDHHNAQILCTIAGIMFLQRSFANPRLGWIAGALFGVCLVIGLEALPLIAIVVAVAIAVAAFEPDLRPPLRRAVRACLCVLLLGFVATTPSARWGAAVCDELSANLLVLVGAVAIALAVMKVRYPNLTPWQWLAGVCLGGCAGMAGYLALEPACVAGPFGQVDTVAKDIWMSDTIETLSMLSFAEVSPAGALAFVVFVLIAIGVRISAWRARRDAASLFAMATIIAVAAYSVLFVKLMAYAMWLAIPIIAVWLARLPAAMGMEARVVRLGAAVLVSQATLVFVFGSILAGFSNVEARARAALTTPTKVCQNTSEHSVLAGLTPGASSRANSTLARTLRSTRPHRVVAAPYHRLDRAIVLSYRDFRLPPRAVGKDAEADRRQLRGCLSARRSSH